MRFVFDDVKCTKGKQTSNLIDISAKYVNYLQQQAEIIIWAVSCSSKEIWDIFLKQLEYKSGIFCCPFSTVRDSGVAIDV